MLQLSITLRVRKPGCSKPLFSPGKSLDPAAQLQEEGKKIEGSKKLGGRKGKVKQTEKRSGERRDRKGTLTHIYQAALRGKKIRWERQRIYQSFRPIIHTLSCVALILRMLTHIRVIFSLAYVQINQSKSPFSRELMSFPARSSAILSHWTNLYLSVGLCFSVCLSLSFLM